MTVRIKICGITRLQDAMAAVDAGADALGFVFVPSSPRAMAYEATARIIRELPPFVTPVGVFVRPTAAEIREAADATGIALAQVHGVLDSGSVHGSRRFHNAFRQEDVPVPCLFAVRVSSQIDHSLLRKLGLNEFLLDTLVEGRDGGTGRPFDWSIAAEAGKYARVVLAGGLTPENVGRAIEAVRPYAVDVSSGVESSPGIKSPEKIRKFVRAVRAAATGS